MMKGEITDGQEKWLLDLVLIGTICDSMKMTKENRILTYYGVKVLEKTRRRGLKELLRTAGVKKMTSEAIGFQLGPRINAAGRMASAELAYNLLNSESRIESAKLAQELEKLNLDRKTEQMAAMKEFEEKGITNDPVIVATGEWHEGVLGIIAGRLVEKYKRPAFVLSKTGEIFKGSGRSFGDFSLAEALKACAGEIIGGGGHAGAAGVKVKEEKLRDFTSKINEYYKSLNLCNQGRFFDIMPDIETTEVGEFNLEFIEELKKLEPFGEGNEVPIFGLRNVTILDKRMMGADDKHLRLMVRGRDEKTLKLVAFNAPERWKKVRQGEGVDLMMSVEENEWNGLRGVEGRILELGGC